MTRSKPPLKTGGICARCAGTGSKPTEKVLMSRPSRLGKSSASKEMFERLSKTESIEYQHPDYICMSRIRYEELQKAHREAITQAVEEAVESLRMEEIPEFYESMKKIANGWGQDLVVDDARVGYNQAVSELNSKIDKLTK